MSSLRDAKKRATCQAISEAAARLALEGGAEAATVAQIAATAAISPRTFHNYFSSVADALLYFTADVLNSFKDEIPSIYPGASFTGFFEQITLEVLADEEKAVRSIPSLFKLGETLENLSHTKAEKQRFEDSMFGVVDAFRTRYPHLSHLEVIISLQACAGATSVVMKEINNAVRRGAPMDTKEQKALVDQAFRTVRSIA